MRLAGHSPFAPETPCAGTLPTRMLLVWGPSRMQTIPFKIIPRAPSTVGATSRTPLSHFSGSPVVARVPRLNTEPNYSMEGCISGSSPPVHLQRLIPTCLRCSLVVRPLLACQLKHLECKGKGIVCMLHFKPMNLRLAFQDFRLDQRT